MILKRLHKTAGYSAEPAIDALKTMRPWEKEQRLSRPGSREFLLFLLFPQFTQKNVTL